MSVSKKMIFDSQVQMINTFAEDCSNDEIKNEPMFFNSDFAFAMKHGGPADVCPTIFAIGPIGVPAVNKNEIVYEKWHEEIEEHIRCENIGVIKAEDRKLYYFDWQTFHTGTKAVKNGWRWFGRVSRNTDRVNNITNEIRVNAQVYLEFPNKGW